MAQLDLLVQISEAEANDPDDRVVLALQRALAILRHAIHQASDETADVDVGEAARIMRISEGRAIELAEQRKIDAIERGGQWYFDMRSCHGYRTVRHRRGSKTKA